MFAPARTPTRNICAGELTAVAASRMMMTVNLFMAFGVFGVITYNNGASSRASLSAASRSGPAPAFTAGRYRAAGLLVRLEPFGHEAYASAVVDECRDLEVVFEAAVVHVRGADSGERIVDDQQFRVQEPARVTVYRCTRLVHLADERVRSCGRDGRIPAFGDHYLRP